MSVKPKLAVILVVLAALLIAPLTALAQDPTQPFTSEDGTLTFLYPEGWVVEEFFGTILITSSQEVADQFFSEGTLTSGQGVILILVPSAMADQFGTTAGMDSAAILTAFMADDPTGMSPVETVTIGDRQVARSFGEQDEMMVVAYAIEFGELGAVLLVQATPPGEESGWEPTTRAIIATMQASAAVEPAETGNIVWQQQFEIDRENSAPGSYQNAGKVQVGPDDTIYVLDYVSGIHSFSADGTPLGLVTLQDGSWSPSTYTLAPDGTLWTLDFMGMVIQYDLASGQPLSQFDMSTVAENAYFGQDMAFGPDGNLYLLNPREDAEDGTAIGEVLVLSPTGELLRSFEVGRDEYFFDALLTIGPDGLIYVAERYGDNGITIFDNTGTQVNAGISTRDMYAISGLALAADGTLFTAVPDSPVLHLAQDGTVLARFGKSHYEQENYDYSADKVPAFEPGYFSSIAGLGVLSNGDVVVADASSNWWQLVRITLSE